VYVFIRLLIQDINDYEQKATMLTLIIVIIMIKYFSVKTSTFTEIANSLSLRIYYISCIVEFIKFFIRGKTFFIIIK
jgi:hypothetical protein